MSKAHRIGLRTRGAGIEVSGLADTVHKRAFFKPNARLLLHLGDELIKNESIAVLELVKNAYDADASRVSLTLNGVHSASDGVITIEDDGTGMDLKTVSDVWMEPGSDHKTKPGRQVTERFGRTVLGEKGVGRFAVHKLGDTIEMTTRRSGKKEVYVRIDWNTFKNSKCLEDVPITIEEREPREFTGKRTGTKLVIRNLGRDWDRRMLRTVYRSYNSLRFPYDSAGAFKTTFDTDRKEWLEGIPSREQMEELALFRFECDMEGDRITRFDYEFAPWPSMKRIKPRRVTERGDFGKAMAMMDADKNPIDLSRHKIGRIRFRGRIFDLDPLSLGPGLRALHGAGEKKGLAEYLKQNGGIRVFRDDMRVYGYGEPDNDWLSLDTRRVNMPGTRIGNNLILASVHLDRKASTDLREKTDREGFLENEAYLTFAGAVLYAVERVEDQRRIDKAKIRASYSPTQESEPVISQIAGVKRAINTRIEDRKLRDDLSASMDRMETDYRAVHDTLLRSAGAGLNLGVAVHEMDKVIKELGRALKGREKDPPDRITPLILHLEKLVKGYALTISKGTHGTWSAHQLIEQALFNMEFRFKAHKIEIVFEDRNAAKTARIRCSRSHVVASMMNILDNSIWWLGYANIPDKKIFISAHEGPDGDTEMLFADNGAGFSLPTDMVTEAGVTSKPDGMGLGLHIAQEIMVAHGGSLSFPERADCKVPKEFGHGAIVAFVFRKGGGK